MRKFGKEIVRIDKDFLERRGLEDIDYLVVGDYGDYIVVRPTIQKTYKPIIFSLFRKSVTKSSK